ncbi:hypothetical protein ACFQ61_03630 [Streptomyces sp. NPDC056500]|uniref:hypothetical protein n=1 Tax=Streptomyces sp. NPDC056500 TaxID=3345840 RepID=UPI0036CD867F
MTGFRPEQVVGEATHTVLSPTTPATGPVPKQINGSKRHVAVNTRSLAGGIQLLEQIQQLLAERVLVRAMPGVLGAEDLPQARDLDVKTAGASAALAAFAGAEARVRNARASALSRPGTWRP